MDDHADHNGVPLPPMSHGLWGTPDEAKPLSHGIKKMLAALLGASAAHVTRIPDDEVRLSPIRLSDEDLNAIGAIVGSEYVTTDREQRIRRARGKSYYDLLDWRSGREIDAPDAVVAPANEDEILALLQHCSAQHIAVVPFGGGTSVVGGVTPGRGELRAVISLDMSRFDEVDDVDLISHEATLGAGLSGPHAEMLLAEHGLQIGHYPQSFPYISIGGAAATRSSGQDSAGYGRFDEMVRGITIVTPSGILRQGYAAPSTAAGPDLRQLFLGSEGTLGVITRVRLALHKIPQSKIYEAFSFKNFATGADAIRKAIQQGTGPTVVRLSDEIESSLNLSSGEKIGESDSGASSGCLCITMYEGMPAHTKSRHEETRTVLLAAGGTSLGEGPARQWEQGRFSAPVLRDGLLDNGAICETLETATSWSNVGRLKQAVTKALTDSLTASGTTSLVMCHISHVYPTGCSLYFTVLGGQRDDPINQWRHAKLAACEAIVNNGGTITHHHSIGTDHRPFMAAEIGELGISLLTSIKKSLDPAGIMNPGKLV